MLSGVEMFMDMMSVCIPVAKFDELLLVADGSKTVQQSL